jgi:hypothetical protein
VGHLGTAVTFLQIHVKSYVETQDSSNAQVVQ